MNQKAFFSFLWFKSVFQESCFLLVDSKQRFKICISSRNRNKKKWLETLFSLPISDVDRDENPRSGLSNTVLEKIAKISLFQVSDILFRGEVTAFFNDTLIPAWVTWKKVDEIAREEKEEVFIDFSGLIVSSKTTLASVQSDSVVTEGWTLYILFYFYNKSYFRKRTV